MQQVINIAEQVKEKITDDSDIVWTSFDTPAAFRKEIDTCIQQLQQNNLAGLTTLNLLFGPTASIQEHAISNGWPDEYIQLSEEFDQLYVRSHLL